MIILPIFTIFLLLSIDEQFDYYIPLLPPSQAEVSFIRHPYAASKLENFQSIHPPHAGYIPNKRGRIHLLPKEVV